MLQNCLELSESKRCSLTDLEKFLKPIEIRDTIANTRITFNERVHDCKIWNQSPHANSLSKSSNISEIPEITGHLPHTIINNIENNKYLPGTFYVRDIDSAN